jgi:hypothetical protein
MRHLFESYTEYLSSNPGEFTSLIMWIVTSTIVTIVLVVYRKKMSHGASGENGFMESAEQVVWIMNWVWPYALGYSVFFQAVLPVWCWYFMSGCIAWALGGRWLFEWALAFRAGKTSVDDPIVTKTVTEKKIETKEQSTTKTDEIK